MATGGDESLKYEQVIQGLRIGIENGAYPPGAKLPSHHQLMEQYRVSRPTVVEALRRLRAGGWIDTQMGSGSFVRSRIPLTGQQDRSQPGQRLLDRSEIDVAADLLQAGIVVAPKRVNSLLELEPGAKAFLRQYLISDDAQPIELISAWFPLDLVKGTELASPEPLTDSIRRHLYNRKKIRLDHAVERIIARAASADEASMLKLPDGAPVLSLIVTGHDAAGTARQLVDAVLPGTLHELRDTYSLA